MFSTHQAKIAKLAKKNKFNMAYTLIFCISTANASLKSASNTTKLIKTLHRHNMLPASYEDFNEKNRKYCAAGLTGQKYDAILYTLQNVDSIYQAYKTKTPIEFWHYLMDECKGLGLIKAAFAVQCLYGEMVCLDVHNAREYNLDIKLLSRHKSSQKAREYYLEVSNKFSSQSMWDEWCNSYAKRYNYKSGYQVSEEHLLAIV